MTTTSNTPVFLRIRAVSERIGLSRSTIYRLVEANRFPQPSQIGDRAIAWRSDEIESWMASRVRGSRKEG